MLVTHVAAERAVAEGLIVPVFHSLDIDERAFLIEQARIEFVIEVLRPQRMFVEHLEDDSVNDDGFKYLRDVKTERIAALAWCVQKRDGRIELRLMDSPERLRIAHHIAERDERVDLVLRWLLGTRAHLVIIKDDIKGIIIQFADISLNAHHLFHGSGRW